MHYYLLQTHEVVEEKLFDYSERKYLSTVKIRNKLFDLFLLQNLIIDGNSSSILSFRKKLIFFFKF